MKTWLTVAVLLALGIVFDIVMMGRLREGTGQMQELVTAIQESVMAEQWDQCQSQVEDLDQLWDQTRKRIHPIMMHEELEMVEESLAELNALIITHNPDDTDDILAALARLRTVLTHLAARYSFSGENLI